MVELDVRDLRGRDEIDSVRCHSDHYFTLSAYLSLGIIGRTLIA